MRNPVTIDFSAMPTAVQAMADAVSLSAKPRGWCESEYVMTKTTAQRVVRAVGESPANPVTLDLFDWSCLSGELARLYTHLERTWDAMGDSDPLRDELERRAADALAVFSHIRQTELADPGVAAFIAASDEFEREQRRLERSRRRLEKMERRFREQEMAMRKKSVMDFIADTDRS